MTPWLPGVRRGWTEFRQEFAPGRLPSQLLWPVATLVAIVWFRDTQLGPVSVGTVSLGTAMYPSVLGLFTVLGVQLMMYYLAADREDGTLLRARSSPRGVAAYLIGKVTLCSLTLLVHLAIVGVPGAFLVDGLAPVTVGRSMMLVSVIVVGALAAQAIGAVLGALVPSVKAVGLAGASVMGLIAVSGIFYPITALPTWLQWVGQATPLYWVGLGTRSALLPDAAAAVEIAGSWRPGLTIAVLVGWAIVGVVLAPPTLRAMTRKESGTRLARLQERAVSRPG